MRANIYVERITFMATGAMFMGLALTPLEMVDPFLKALLISLAIILAIFFMPEIEIDKRK